MRCPFCGSDETQVKDSRPAEDGAAIRRRRSCPACGSRFTTFERVQLREMTVLKTEAAGCPSTGRSWRGPSASRCASGRWTRTGWSGSSTASSASWRPRPKSEVTSRQIGEIVLLTLKEVDQVAYVRFASVYQNFGEAKDFREFLGKMDGG